MKRRNDPFALILTSEEATREEMSKNGERNLITGEYAMQSLVMGKLNRCLSFCIHDGGLKIIQRERCGIKTNYVDLI